MNRVNSCNLGNMQVQCRSEFLRQFIGRRCTCEFYMEEDIVKKTGLLNSVGVDYIALTSINNPEERLVCLLCDLKFIKFC